MAAASARELGALASFKLLVSVAVLLSGYEGVSDDDYARVVIAQQFAHAPQLDASGTSWLPLPFWLTGGVMMAAGSSLLVARAVGLALGVASIVLIRLAAAKLARDRTEALAGTLIAAVLPWSARLGASMVPELPVAAACLFALATLRETAAPALRIWGGLALLGASLSRYEPWFIALGFAALSLRDAARAPRSRLPLVAGAVLALIAPVLWTLWSKHAHGSYLSYLDSVAAYKQAADQGALGERALAYVFATFRAEPELLLLLAFASWRVFAGRFSGATLRAELAPFWRPCLLVLALFLALTIASLQGGAPTHHPERALLVLHLLLALLTGALLVRAAREKRLGSPLRIGIALLALAPLLYMLRAWFLYRESFAHRKPEIAMGKVVARASAADDTVLFVDAPDYGYFAVLAGSGVPWRFTVRPSAADAAVDDAPVDVAAAARDGGFRFLLVPRALKASAVLDAVHCEPETQPPRPGLPLCLYRVGAP